VDVDNFTRAVAVEWALNLRVQKSRASHAVALGGVTKSAYIGGMSALKNINRNASARCLSKARGKAGHKVRATHAPATTPKVMARISITL
jgi:hypothetical protein